MATTSTSTAVIAVEPVFTEPERLALAGFLAGYTDLTREAYALDLRQYASWCQQHTCHCCSRITQPHPRTVSLAGVAALADHLGRLPRRHLDS